MDDVHVPLAWWGLNPSCTPERYSSPWRLHAAVADAISLFLILITLIAATLAAGIVPWHFLRSLFLWYTVIATLIQLTLCLGNKPVKPKDSSSKVCMVHLVVRSHSIKDKRRGRNENKPPRPLIYPSIHPSVQRQDIPRANTHTQSM